MVDIKFEIKVLFFAFLLYKPGVGELGRWLAFF